MITNRELPNLFTSTSKICTKYRKHWEIKTGQVKGWSTFEGVFFQVLMGKKVQIRISAYCSIRSKKLSNIKVRKRYVLHSKCTFGGQNRLKISRWERIASLFSILDTNLFASTCKKIVQVSHKNCWTIQYI